MKMKAFNYLTVYCVLFVYFTVGSATSNEDETENIEADLRFLDISDVFSSVINSTELVLTTLSGSTAAILNVVVTNKVMELLNTCEVIGSDSKTQNRVKHFIEGSLETIESAVKKIYDKLNV
ncbi:uncharacterized protein LOC130904172 [Diorhabda carinulata]|uniref:uncharacterized protein LOC130904172 n=1 Tax=Diorhabda carinulata TaxID=1163345 RepID=UPI0025A266C9|nr:uncharacterized protein LOC130904172 [Diorhabda carinulata]